MNQNSKPHPSKNISHIRETNEKLKYFTIKVTNPAQPSGTN